MTPRRSWTLDESPHHKNNRADQNGRGRAQRPAEAALFCNRRSECGQDKEQSDKLPCPSRGEHRNETKAAGERTRNRSGSIPRISSSGLASDVVATAAQQAEQHRELTASDNRGGKNDDAAQQRLAQNAAVKPETS